MAKLSKKKKQIAEKIEPGKNYPIEEAVSLISEFASNKFSESFKFPLLSTIAYQALKTKRIEMMLLFQKLLAKLL